MRKAGWVVVFVVALVVAGCSDEEPDPTSGESDTSSPSATPSSTPTETPSPPAAVIDGLYRAAGDYRLAVRCWGRGSPTIVYDAGTDDSGIDETEGSAVVQQLAQHTRVCSYDRAGTGASDAAPPRKRYLDDVVEDLHAVLLAAGVRPPYLLVGSSGGGFDVYHHAGRYPDDVVGLVMLDVPRGQADIPREEVPPWNSPENPEHMDYVAVEHQMAVDRLPIPAIPVTVVTATQGQSADPKEQRVWLEGSSDPKQVVVESGHDVFSENPDAAVRSILGVLTAAAR